MSVKKWRPFWLGLYVLINLVIWQSFDEPAEDQFQVHPGDIIGIHYITVVSGDGVVSYEQYGTTSTDGLSPGQLSRFIAMDLLDRALPIGVRKSIAIRSANRLPALEPVTHCCEEIYDLTGMFLLPYIIRLLTWVENWFKVAQQQYLYS